uniref:Uncharacterized protein n=1 Tax=Phakopsora pachyrhizi TaxID=170000 RepID=A0A0S1MJA9_PHAPC
MAVNHHANRFGIGLPHPIMAQNQAEAMVEDTVIIDEMLNHQCVVGKLQLFACDTKGDHFVRRVCL